MKKYTAIFLISWQNGFVYRVNFLLWRVRSLVVVFTTYFLWKAIFQNNGVIFGYTREKILTYVFLTLVVRSLVMGLRSIDSAGEIADGRLSNYLLKPLNYHLYWFVRDIADKLLNIIFSVFEIGFFYFLFKPPIFWQKDLSVLALFGAALFLAIVLNFLLANFASNFAFWMPNNAWGFWFVFLVFQELLGGVMFPLDIFPPNIYNLIRLLPFPYLLFFPVNIYLGKIAGLEVMQGVLIAFCWVLAAILLLNKEWRLGLKTYQSEGR